MQDVHPINGGGGGRLFGDRRLRPHLHPNNHQALKCPRCDSSNTKFCYYNNYNLSQPRHFCKNCRRYWTKGGVLRNVPVGGGCRKSKRSSKPKTAKHQSTTTTKTTTSVSHSSSESSNNNNTVTASAVAVNCNSGRRDLFQISDADQNFSIRNLDTFTKNNLNNNSHNNNNSLLFSGEFMNLMSFDGAENGTATTTTTSSFGQFSAAGVHNWDMVKLSGANEVDNDDKMSGVLDQTVTIDDLLQNRGNSVGIATLDDWQHPTAENDHQGLFDFSSTVDHQEYWSQSTATVQDHHTHWSHDSNDQPLFLP